LPQRPARQRRGLPLISNLGQPKPSWQQLAHEGQFDQAYDLAYRAAPVASAAPPRPLTPPTTGELGPADLLLLADVARLSHHPADAVSPLERLLHAHAADPRAPLAAFTLGRVLLDDLGRPREAAEAFQRAQVLEPLGPDGPLAQDALAREVEAWSHAGEPQRARERALEYVRHYPAGRRLRSVRHYGELD
jgi:transmembrane sensor